MAKHKSRASLVASTPARPTPPPLNTSFNSNNSSSTSSAAPTPRPVRPILRKKKSVTFHPSTKPSSPGGLTPPAVARPLATLLEYAELAPHRLDNVFIHSGYRAETASHIEALGSVFALHNETCNIWTHLFPLLLLLPGAWWFLSTGLHRHYPSHTTGDWWAFAAFFAGTATMLLASSLWHTFSCLGPRAAKVWNGIDYAGIVACVWGSFVACLHFGLPDEGPDWDGRDPGRARRTRYEGMISALALVCVVVSVLPRFRTPGWRPFRAAMFVAMGLSAVFPVVHGLVLFGWRGTERQMGLSWVVLQGALYITGAGLYAARIPEKLAPGRFDLFGASHQIFHALVVLAATSHLVGLLKALGYACSVR